MTIPRRFTAVELENLPTLCQGQMEDLKIEDEDGESSYRVWLARTHVEDGEPYNDRISIERYIDGRWVVTEDYPG